VAVGQYQAIGSNDDTGPDAGRMAVLCAHFNAHHGRTDGVGNRGDRIRIGVEDFSIVDGRGRSFAGVPDVGRRGKIEHWRVGVKWIGS
jgi:hypothetical protein